MTIQRIVRYQQADTGTGTANLHPHPVLNRVFAARGVSEAEDLDTSLNRLLPPTSLGDIGKATDRLRRALELGETITIVGDFDADGATSTALAVSALTAMGAKRVEFLIPTRRNGGYGLSPELVERAADFGAALILTVDNGIAAHRGIERATALNIDVIVTDHHLPGDELPACSATVNPNVPGDTFASKNLSGVGVTFYVMAALRAALREETWFEMHNLPVPRLADWLDLVAVGTVADLVALDANNRRLVEQGLRRIRAGRCRPGISALIAFGRREQSDVVASDLAYSVAPRLNAAGRLDDMARGVHCLLEDDVMRAQELAQTLESLNQERRVIESQMRESADLTVQKLRADGRELPAGLSLHHPEWHPGVVGILAGRIKERHHRPTVAFAASEHGLLVGSARSVPGLHIRDVIAEVASAHPEIVLQFGGHAMAAGLTIPAPQLGQFDTLFADVCAQHLGDTPATQLVHTDGLLPVDDFNLDFARAIRFAAPWGQAFPEPQFDGEFTVQRSRVVGERHLQLELSAAGHHQRLAGIAFGQASFHGLSRAHMVYRLEINSWRGRETLQLNVSHILPCE